VINTIKLLLDFFSGELKNLMDKDGFIMEGRIPARVHGHPSTVDAQEVQFMDVLRQGR